MLGPEALQKVTVICFYTTPPVACFRNTTRKRIIKFKFSSVALYVDFKTGNIMHPQNLFTIPTSKISGKWIRIFWLKIAFKPTSSVIKIVDFIGLNNRIRARPAIRFLAGEQIYFVISSIQLLGTGFFQQNLIGHLLLYSRWTKIQSSYLLNLL